MCLARRRGYVVDEAYTSFVIPCNNNENNNHNRLLVRYTRIFIYLCMPFNNQKYGQVSLSKYLIIGKSTHTYTQMMVVEK